VRRAPAPGAWDDYSHVDTPARTATPVGDATRAPLARPQATRGALHRTCRNHNVSPGGRDFFSSISQARRVSIPRAGGSSDMNTRSGSARVLQRRNVTVRD